VGPLARPVWRSPKRGVASDAKSVRPCIRTHPVWRRSIRRWVRRCSKHAGAKATCARRRPPCRCARARGYIQRGKTVVMHDCSGQPCQRVCVSAFLRNSACLCAPVPVSASSVGGWRANRV
jgi:hypothetical protein